MNNTRIEPPVILAIGGHDPSGGAGLQADIETITAHGCRAVSVVTALTTQNTCGVIRAQAQSTAQVVEQCRLILQDTKIAAIKLGLLGTADIAIAIAAILKDLPQVLTVFDPILVAGYGGKILADTALQNAMLEYLCPHCTMITPNSIEARVLSKQNNLNNCATILIGLGCKAVLITGAHETESMVINRLYNADGLIQTLEWQRLPKNYHGSGCTLASAIAARLSLGDSIATAVMQAQSYTWNSLYKAYSGKCQMIPNRFYKCADFL